MNWWLAAWFLWPINCSTCSTCPACPGTALLTIPLWVFLGNKTSKRHIYLVGAILSCDDLRWDVFLLTSQSSWGAEGAALTKIWQECFPLNMSIIFGSCRFWQNLFRNKKYHPFLYWGLALFWKPTNFPLRQRYYLENLHIPKNNQWLVQIFLVKWSHFFRGDLPY